ncbi:prolyl oligopeptidase family serine peptidase [Kitasatospora sp. RB6PN24]|uniref:alpha/beta hydrolase n=1 Tax=Kitasatospora humi TaxID=2893891 RepID=UPI001E613450|nr:prolyl oligopeptidase family serine peptidase [Kitasatospora humi]MCC9308300.1 prolyl oligopeptidase family serine peptidase [Kitasatospora humi]
MRWGTVVASAATVAIGAGVAMLLVGRRVSDLALRPEAAEHGPIAGEPVLRVLRMTPREVTLTRTADSGRRGIYAVDWPGGHAVVGDVLATGAQTVVRRVERSAGSPPADGTEVELSYRVLRGDPGSACGLDYMDVVVDGELGGLPAWYVPGVRGTWVILVHGPLSDRRQALPVLPVLHRLRLPALVVSYRGDQGAPASPDGLGHFGETEWQDVEAAIRFAKDAGAGRIVLYGWSVGATTVLQTAARSDHRDDLAALVLDSPVLEAAATVREVAAMAGAGTVAGRLGAWAVQGRTGIDLAGLARIADGTDLASPTLLLAASEDGVAPLRDAERLAERRSDLVSLHAFPGAGHAGLWNADPARYEELLRRFLTPIL